MLVIAGKLAAKTLLDRLRECRQSTGSGIALPELLGYMQQLAEAIDFLNAPQHLLGGRTVSIQHRDIRPVNVVFHGESVKLGNFALARTVEGTSTAMPGDHAGLNCAYAAPEMSNDRITRWTDQYSLAITYVQARTGELPFNSNCSSPELRDIHRQGRLDLTPLPDRERDVIARATSLTPDQRFNSCSEMVRALGRASDIPKVVEVAPPQPKEPEPVEPARGIQPDCDAIDPAGKREKRAQPSAPFGWRYTADGQRVENELELEAIRLIGHLRAEGYSSQQILAVLDPSGFPSSSEGSHATAR
jgi:serine/threonine-protein kinase